MIKKVLAIVVDYNTYEEAAKLTQQLLEPGVAKSFALSVVLVDNGNRAALEVCPELLRSGVELLRVEKNDGYAAGLVAAIDAHPGFDAYWLLNSDLEIEKDTLQKLVKVLNENEHVGAVGPRVYKGRTNKVWGTRGVLNLMMGSTAMTDWHESGALPKWSYIPGCSILVRKTAYEEVGGLPLEYRMYYEETDLCIRLQKAGWDLWVQLDAIAYHSVKSMERGIPARHYAYYLPRNNLYFWSKNFRVPWPLQLPRMGMMVARELVAPLRNAATFKEVEDRLLYIGAGIIDSVPFSHRGKALFDKFLFPR